MPASKKTPTKGKGKGLKKNLGPFPTYVWLIIGGLIVLVYLYYRHSKNQTSAAGSENQQIIPSGIVVPPPSNSGQTSSGDSSGGVSSSPVDFPYDYVTNTDLQSGLDNLHNQVAADIGSITFPQPTVNITVPHSAIASTTTKSKQAAKKASATTTKKIQYFTYKRQVRLKPGQTIHYARNRGYYAK